LKYEVEKREISLLTDQFPVCTTHVLRTKTRGWLHRSQSFVYTHFNGKRYKVVIVTQDSEDVTVKGV